MPETGYCPQCGAVMPVDAPQGVCPKCVMNLGLNNPFGGPAATVDAAGRERFPPPEPEELGELFPKLEILELIGRGGMGAVYKARQRGLDRLVALKILPPAAAQDPSFSERFTREARALAKLNHPNIVTIHDFGQAGGLYYFVMEFVEGVNLRQAITAGHLTPQQALAIVPQICEALQFAHDEGVVHRDIKPENVLLDKRGRVKVADFGLARLLGQAQDATLTGANQVMGTPRYMAPEQMEGAHNVDHRADIYSLGVVFYELLTGELPLGRFAPPSKKVHIDVRLDEVVLRSLEKEPGRRYQHASQLKTDVESIGKEEQLVGGVNGYEYRSQANLFGLPLIHVARGFDAGTGRRRVAKGVIAVGDVAVGVLAIGGVSLGCFSLGGTSFGVFTFGGVSIGLLVAIGGLSIGALALGGMALGLVAIGGGAVGYLAYGGGAWGTFGYGGNVQDPRAQAAFGQFVAPLLAVALPCSLVVPLLLLLVCLAVAGGHRRRRQAAAHDKEFPHRDRQRREPTHWIGCFVAVVLMGLGLLLLLPVVALLVYFLSSSPMPSQTTLPATGLSPAAGQLAGPDGRLGVEWDAYSGAPALPAELERDLELEPSQRQRVDTTLRGFRARYLAIEVQHTRPGLGTNGRQVTIIEPLPAAEMEALEMEFWQQLDTALDATQQLLARGHLGLYRNDYPRSGQSGQGLFGWGREGCRVELWRFGQRYQWAIAAPGWQLESEASTIPADLARFWRSEQE